MIKFISAYQARTNFGELINQVYYQGIPIVVTKTGKPMVKITRVNGDDERVPTAQYNTLPKLYGIWAGRKDWQGKTGAIIVRELRKKRLTRLYTHLKRF